IDQSNNGTCGPTSVEFSVADTSPSEYVRLVAGLASNGGEVKMRGGDSLHLQENYLTPRQGDTRTLSEMVFQSAAAAYAHGQKGDGASPDSLTNDGASYDGINKLAEQVYGVKYQSHSQYKSLLPGPLGALQG